MGCECKCVWVWNLTSYSWENLRLSLAFILSMWAGSSETDTVGWLVMPVNHITQTYQFRPWEHGTLLDWVLWAVWENVSDLICFSTRVHEFMCLEEKTAKRISPEVNPVKPDIWKISFFLKNGTVYWTFRQLINVFLHIRLLWLIECEIKRIWSSYWGGKNTSVLFRGPTYAIWCNCWYLYGQN